MSLLRQVVCALSVHLRRSGWVYIFSLFILAITWYGSMNVLAYLKNSPFSIDLMPLIAGAAIIPISWQAVSLRDRLLRAIGDFDDGAAFVFPLDRPGSKKRFLDDLGATIRRFERIGGGVIGTIAMAGAIIITYQFADERSGLGQLAPLLLVGMSLIGLAMGVLLGELLGYAQLPEVMRRNEIVLAGLSTPQARQALQGLENVYNFAIFATTTMCLWFSGWWIYWAWGGPAYIDFNPKSFLYPRLFVLLWIVSIVLLVLTGIIPALKFRRLVRELAGGRQEREAIVQQIAQAEVDLSQLKDSQAGTARRRRERSDELLRFIANLKQQQIGSWALNPWLHVGLMLLNLALFVVPFYAGPAGMTLLQE